MEIHGELLCEIPILTFNFLSRSLSLSHSRRSTLWAWGTVILKMLPHGGHTCSAYSTTPFEDPADDREERILAILGIIGTVLNLLVVIFVYIYTTI